MLDLPESFYADLLDESKKEIVIPPGEWRIPKGIRINRSNVKIVGDNSILYPETLQTPFKIESKFLHGGFNRIEYHAFGNIVVGTTTLTLMETVDFKVGEVVLVRSGIRSDDPAEPEFQTYQTIKSINDNIIEFEMPFYKNTKQYTSYDSILALAGEWQRYKTGPWESRNGYYSRGLGLDHGIIRFLNSDIIENITVKNLTVKWSKELPTIYDATSFFTQWARNVRYYNINILNPRGTCLRFTHCENSGVEKLTVRGHGDSNPYNDINTHTCATLIALWGGVGCYAKDLFAEGKNIRMMDCEVGSASTLIERVNIKTFYDQSYKGTTQLQISGNHPGFICRDITLSLPTRGSSTFTAFMPSNFILENLHFTSDEISDSIPLHKYRQLGFIKIGSKVFGPLQKITTTTYVTKNGQSLDIPPALYRSASITVSTRVGILEISGPSYIFYSTTGNKFILPSYRWGIVEMGTLQKYFDSRVVKIWLQPNTTPITVTFEGECYL